VTSGLIAIPVKGLGEGEMTFVAEDQGDSVPVRRYRPTDIVLVIAVRFALNIGSVLKDIIKVEGIVVLGIKAVDSVLLLNAVVLR
jgi:hypothetical protein